MRTIAIINQKGGCGKTTVSINLSAVLASKGLRTLLVDLDPQSHCSLGLAVPENQVEYSIGDALRAGLDGSLSVADITWQVARNLDLAPSRMSLAAIEQELSGAGDRDRRLQQVLSTVDQQYDFCVIDCPPSIGLLTFNALRAAGEVITPVETGYFALQGAIRQEETIGLLAQRVNHHVRFHVLATMYDLRTKLAREILAELKRHFGDRLLPDVVHFNSKLKEAASFGQPITEYDTGSRGMADFKALVEWLLANPPKQRLAGGEASAENHPALSRAAEMVERARALSGRTAALAAKISARQAIVPDPGADPTIEVEPNLAEVTGPRRGAITNKAYGVRVTNSGLLFVQPAEGGARQVGVAGDFNGWDPTATPMRRDTELGVWQVCVKLPPGRYRYRIVIDGKWAQDPHNRYVETNPFGELNSVIEVVAAEPAAEPVMIG